MKTRGYLGMAPGDLEGKPYAKYWNPEMAPMQEHARRALLHGPEAAELGFPVAQADLLLEPGYLPMENGFTRLDNGQVFVSVLTEMPRVTSAMIDWWFGWHWMESQRYKLWHPRAHVLNRAARMVGDDPRLSDREKYLDNPNYVTEYVGDALLDIEITFRDAADYLDTSRFDSAGVGTALCGTVGFQRSPVVFGLLIHLIRATADGCEMRSRFWLGRIELNGFPGAQLLSKFAASRFVARRAVLLEQGRDMVAHCAMEMNHLAGFLPDLYADYHRDG
jgi:hypothetical protein